MRRLKHWIRKWFCEHYWCDASPMHHDEISIKKWYYCPKCDNWMLVRYGSQCTGKLPCHQKIYLGGN